MWKGKMRKNTCMEVKGTKPRRRTRETWLEVVKNELI